MNLPVEFCLDSVGVQTEIYISRVNKTRRAREYSMRGFRRQWLIPTNWTSLIRHRVNLTEAAGEQGSRDNGYTPCMLPRNLRLIRLSRRIEPFDSDQFIFGLKVDGFRGPEQAKGRH